MTPRQLTVLLSLGIVWGSSFLFIRVLVDADMDPLGVAAARLAVGSLFLVPLAWLAREQLPRDAKTWVFLAGLGLFNFALPWTLFPLSEQHIPSGVASIANSCTPLWASVFAAFTVPGEHFTSRRAAGLGLGFVGITVLMANDVSGIDGGAVWGILGVVLATLLYGASAVFIRLRMSHVRPIALTAGQIGVAAAVMIPLALATNAYGDARMGAAEWGSVAALGGLGSGVAVIAYMWLIGSLGPVRASVVTYLMPPVGVLLGWAVLDEEIGWNLVLAILLIVSGVALVQNLSLRRLPRAAYRRVVPSSAAAEP
ncbi:MAG TPA: EamA family transporter [Tepidiformaceae bacterium]|nr:EamA family transporter [Tepidiformaceae bacterium]HSE46771.1 EamA family transporter [Gemmatimonadales bacterium]